jgi:hypothetical protein
MDDSRPGSRGGKIAKQGERILPAGDLLFGLSVVDLA